MAAGDYAVRVETSSTDEVGELARAFNRMAADLATVDRAAARPGRDGLARAAYAARRPWSPSWRTSTTGSPSPTRPRSRWPWARPSGSATWSRDLLDLSRVDAGVVRPGPERRTRRRPGRRGGRRGARRRARGVTFDVPGRAGRPDGARRPLAPAPAARQPARQRCAAQPGRRCRAGLGGRSATSSGSRSSDEGAGIAPEDRERVFVRFGTLADPTGGGTGLGLAIARWVTDLHGGRIGLVDPVAGETGARFRVELPAVPGATVPAITSDAAPRRNHVMSTPTAPHAHPCGSLGAARQVDRRRGLRRPLARSRRPRAPRRPARVPGDRGLRRADPAVRRPRARGRPGAAGRGRPGARRSAGSDGGRSPGRARSCAPGSP